MSPALLGKQVDGIWHTGIVVYNREYYFGGGICADPIGGTPYGTPHTIESMGTSTKTPTEFRDFLSSIAPNFTFATYHLLDNNCNNFSDQCCQFLVGKSIPQYILDLPSEAMNSPLGPVIRPFIEQMQSAIQQQSVGHEVQLQSSSSARAIPNTSVLSPTSNNAIPAAGSRSRPYWSSPVTLEKGDRKVISSKLQEFAPEYKQNPEELAQLSSKLPPHKAFPALDLLRLHVAESAAIADEFASLFHTLAHRFILSEDVPVAARMMTLRGAVNTFKHSTSSESMCRGENLNTVVDCITDALTKENALIHKTGALLALNLAGAHRRHFKIPKLEEDKLVQLLFCIVERLNAGATPAAAEARPLLCALIVLVDEDPDAVVLVKTFGLDLEVYQNEESCADGHTRTAASDLDEILSSG